MLEWAAGWEVALDRGQSLDLTLVRTTALLGAVTSFETSIASATFLVDRILSTPPDPDGSLEVCTTE